MVDGSGARRARNSWKRSVVVLSENRSACCAISATVNEGISARSEAPSGAMPASGGPGVLIELLDPGNVSLFQHRRGEVIVSPVILSHMLAQVALRRELRAVFDELFGPGGAEIVFRPAAEFGLLGRDASFREIETAVASRAGVALGVRTAAARGRGSGGGVTLNPPREQRWRLQDGDEIVALTAP